VFSRAVRLGGGNPNARVTRIMRVTRVIRRKKRRADPQVIMSESK